MIHLKKAIATATTIAAIGLSSTAFAAYGLPEAPVSNDGIYIGAFGGLTYTPRVTDNSLNADKTNFNNPNWDIGGRIGYRMDQLRFEAEYIYQRSNLAKSSVDLSNTSDVDFKDKIYSHSGMFNLLYDIMGFGLLGSSASPYIGGGIGVSNINTTTTTTDATGAFFDTDGSTNRFAYQVMAGVNYRIMEKADIGLGYRYFGTTKTGNFRYQNHMFNIEMNYYI